MSKIDIISQICVFNDYPIYRQLIRKYRNKFNKVILYPSRHHGQVDLEEFLKRSLPETWVTGHTIDWTTPNIDWRQAETEPCLELSSSEWILFLEQDFFVKDWDILFEQVESLMEESDLIGWWQDSAFSYVHPCFLLIKRSLLEKTKKDFRAHPEINGCDHFAMITHDALELGAKIITLQGLGYTPWEDAFHLGGLTYPYQDFKGDDTIFGVGSPEAFRTYNYYAAKAPVEQSLDWLDLSSRVEAVLSKKFPIFKPEDSIWAKFFKL